MRTKDILTKTALYTAVVLGAVTMLVPFLWMILTAFKSVSESVSVAPFVIFPTKWRTDSFSAVWHNMSFPRLYINTLALIGGRVFFACLTATAAGYAFARLHFFGKNAAFALVLFQMMVPSQIFIIPQYLMICALHSTNTIFALIFPGMVSAFGTFLLRQGFLALPKELEEAALLDGCSIPQTFALIMLPLVKSTLVALGIFTAVFAFKDLMWPLIVNTDKQMLTLSAALAKMQGQYATNFPQLMAASLIACVPMLLLYVLFQKHFIAGIATSGGKL